MNSKQSNRRHKDRNSGAASPGGFFSNKATRETVESIVIAFILAFLFRAFEAEAFVIPTGSMAPTLQGRHKDVNCAECGHNFRSSASQENRDGRRDRDWDRRGDDYGRRGPPAPEPVVPLYRVD